MERSCEEILAALASGESDRINPEIDRVSAMEIDERARLQDACFYTLTGLYADSDDGYVRQSTVRLLDTLGPGLPAAVHAMDAESSMDVDGERVTEQTDALRRFLLDAITDTDGRVRQSAKHALKDVSRTYEGLGELERLESMAEELDETAESHSGTRRKHVLEAKEDAEYFLQPGFGRASDAILEAFGVNMDR